MHEITEMSLVELRERLTSTELTAEEATARYIDRIESYSFAGPKLNAVRELNPEAMSIASDLDRERREGLVRSPLHGVPILLKDNMGTDDTMATTAGVKALETLRTPFDAALARKLRAAGAVILGKCSCPDFCDYMSSAMPSEHSSTGGTIGHPYGLRYERAAARAPVWRRRSRRAWRQRASDRKHKTQFRRPSATAPSSESKQPSAW